MVGFLLSVSVSVLAAPVLPPPLPVVQPPSVPTMYQYCFTRWHWHVHQQVLRSPGTLGIITMMCAIAIVMFWCVGNGMRSSNIGPVIVIVAPVVTVIHIMAGTIVVVIIGVGIVCAIVAS